MDFGSMKEIIFDNDSCNTVILFLKDNKIEYHSIAAGIRTGNSDIERLHGTLKNIYE